MLLDNFVASSARLEAREVEKRVMEQKALRQFRNPLEPLVVRQALREGVLLGKGRADDELR